MENERSPKGSFFRLLAIVIFGFGILVVTRTIVVDGNAPSRPPETAALGPESPGIAPQAVPTPAAPQSGRKARLPAPPEPPPVIVTPEPRPKAPLPARLTEAGFKTGDPVFIRIFKQSAELEIWMKNASGWQLFDTWPVCRWSGTLGPKLKEGDGQSPEGFYTVTKGALNPNSDYHLSFNLGFPNAYDRAHGRTGSFLMVHGDCLSIGCYAMTDAGIEEIYALVEGALDAGQDSVPVHIFPFRMTDDAMAAADGHEWAGYWSNLKQGYDLFESARVPPVAGVCGTDYVFAAEGKPRCKADG